MRKFNCSVIALALLVWACGGASSTEPREPLAHEGVIQLPLTTTSADGQRYRLVGATFAITGTQSLNITDTSVDTLSVPLPAGPYSIRLEGEWRIERVEAPGQTVPASLMSPNPMAFSLLEGETRTVRFLFKVPGNGTADVGFTVDSGGWLSGTFDFDPLPQPEPFNTLGELAGRSVPFIISWNTATVTRVGGPRGFEVRTGPITVQFGGPYSELLHDRLAPSFEQGGPINFSLLAFEYGEVMFIPWAFHSRESENYELGLESVDVTSGGLDAEGYPSLRPVNFETPFRLMQVTPDNFGRAEGTVRVNLSVR
ncbi:hypothetical protein [Pyxidicoccus xibeiensis]|uniref:hypothetical protein n=1 Tax=Pyxidicoccus xibeiensis TaxID=2906759 RepID=UPI0020A80BB9|nr:hypothetical protein [Pyxidicoccus xibeiensis]MCP3137974.1 hypothetical protein [Pyxidicoccus xibeiensis]